MPRKCQRSDAAPLGGVTVYRKENMKQDMSLRRITLNRQNRQNRQHALNPLKKKTLYTRREREEEELFILFYIYSKALCSKGYNRLHYTLTVCLRFVLPAVYRRPLAPAAQA